MGILSEISGWRRAAIIGVVALIVLGALTLGILSQWAKIKEWAVKQLAIENPAKTEVVYKDRFIDRVVTKTEKGDTVIVEKIREVSGSNTEVKPHIPDSPKLQNKAFYLSGGMGYGIGDSRPSYLLGGGVYLLDGLAIGIQAQSDGASLKGFAIVTLSF